MAGSINSAYTWAVQECNAKNVGYSQSYRNQQKINGVVYYDCSSFIWYALKAGGFDVESAYQTATGVAYSGNAITTYNEAAWLTALGFTQGNINGEWKKGDILLRSTHTEMVYTGGTGRGVTMGAHSASYSLDKQVSINDYESTASNYSSLWTYGGASGGLSVSAYVVAAIAGCFKRESGLNPGIWEGLVVSQWTSLLHGYGLGQWTNTDGDTHGRLYQLHDYVTSHGYLDGEGDGQLEFLIHENVWYNSSVTRGKYRTLNEFLTSGSTKLEDLVWDFLANWEGVPGDAYQERLEAAQAFYDYIQQHKTDDPRSFSWYSSNQYLSFMSAQQLGNLMMIYFWFDGYDPGEGGGAGGDAAKRRTRWWMMVKPQRGV